MFTIHGNPPRGEFLKRIFRRSHGEQTINKVEALKQSVLQTRVALGVSAAPRKTIEFKKLDELARRRPRHRKILRNDFLFWDGTIDVRSRLSNSSIGVKVFQAETVSSETQIIHFDGQVMIPDVEIMIPDLAESQKSKPGNHNFNVGNHNFNPGSHNSSIWNHNLCVGNHNSSLWSHNFNVGNQNFNVGNHNFNVGSHNFCPGNQNWRQNRQKMHVCTKNTRLGQALSQLNESAAVINYGVGRPETEEGKC